MYNSKEMFLAAAVGDYKTVAKLLAQDPEHYQINEFYVSNSFLFYAIGSTSFHIGNYKCALLLLEAGANPYQSQEAHYKAAYYTTPFFKALFYQDLALARAMLMYNPDYENVNRKIMDRTFTGRDEVWYVQSAEAKAGKDRNFEDWIKKTAADSRRIIALKAQAERAVTLGHLPDAAIAYEEVARLYGEHAALEDRLIYHPLASIRSKFNPDEARPIFKAHYLKKQHHHLKQLYTWYQAIDDHLSSTIAVSSNQIAYQVHVLNRLIAIGRTLAKDEIKEISPYLRRVAHLIADNPSMPVSTAAPVAPDDIILHSASGSGSESDGESDRLLAGPARPALTFGTFFRWFGFGTDTDTEAKID